MADGKLDVIIFGATGFTGKYVVREFVKIAHEQYSWGIAGRNKGKLEEVLKEISTETGKDILITPIIIADCKDTESINDMTKKARVIVNCCGPYQLYGEVVVKSCIENGCHHVDVSGEPQYMELMQHKYNEDASKNGVYIISACGFDCVPNDLGVVYFMKNFGGVVHSVESYMKLKSRKNVQGPSLNYGTWESAINFMANIGARNKIRKKLFPEDRVPVLIPKLKRRSFVHRSELADNKLCIPFLGADSSVVKRTQFMLYTLQKQRPVQFHPFFVCRDLYTLVSLMIIGLFVSVLSRFDFGVKLLLSYPKIFTLGRITGEEPSVESVSNAVAVIRFRGKGWSYESVQNIEDKTTISLPTNKTIDMEMSVDNPGYGFTSKAIILSALTILDESNNLPTNGGVYTPGSAFYNTRYLNRLVDNGLRITVNK